MLYTIRTGGRIYRVPAAAFETQERLADRAWHIAKAFAVLQDGAPVNAALLISDAHKAVNAKYFGMKY
jgi:hypothetical protein